MWQASKKALWRFSTKDKEWRCSLKVARSDPEFFTETAFLLTVNKKIIEMSFQTTLPAPCAIVVPFCALLELWMLIRHMRVITLGCSLLGFCEWESLDMLEFFFWVFNEAQ